MAKKIYIAGPMRGIKDFNFPAFFAAEEELKAQGYIVFNPARRDEDHCGKGFAKSETGTLSDITDTKFSLRNALHDDTTFISLHADAIALLPGWEKSKGANAEHALAVALGLEVIKIGNHDPAISVAGPADGTNPKDLIGAQKPQVHLVPPALLIWVAKAMENGAAKYGPYNWREKKVRLTVYISAAMRHLLSMLDGEDVASDSKLPHAAHAAACMGIVLDAIECNCLLDDRPKKGRAAQLIEQLTVTTKPAIPDSAVVVPVSEIRAYRETPRGQCPDCGRDWEPSGICRHGKPA